MFIEQMALPSLYIVIAPGAASGISSALEYKCRANTKSYSNGLIIMAERIACIARFPPFRGNLGSLGPDNSTLLLLLSFRVVLAYLKF